MLAIPQASHDRVKLIFNEYPQLKGTWGASFRLPRRVSAQLNKDIKKDYYALHPANLLEDRDWKGIRDAIFRRVKKEIIEEETEEF